MGKKMEKKLFYRSIPKVDILLEEEQIKEAIEVYDRDTVMEAIRTEMEALRGLIRESDDEEEIRLGIDSLISNIVNTVKKMHTPDMRPVINATGTILHTNLGRAPISREHLNRIADVACGYSNLEYDLEAGKRGERYSHFEKLLCRITGAEAAMAVNNNASAVMLILSSMAKGGEVVVSRGELVEIGGKFRIPDVMEQSGASLVEVGTTNKTHYSDYENAITEETKALLKVHTSNYRIVGFTESVPIDGLIPLGEAHDIPIIEDLGSGVLIDLSKYGLTYEPTVQDSIRKGADVVCFSGDKLLGGPQAGIIVGKKKYIDQMKKNQLTRALRIDKFTATALELVLQEYLSEENAIKKIPVLRMITKTKEEVEKDAKRFVRLLKSRKLHAAVCVEECESQIGGGSLPMERISSMGVVIKPYDMTVPELETAMRKSDIPIIPRVVNDTVLMDVRTMDKEKMSLAADELAGILGEEKKVKRK